MMEAPNKVFVNQGPRQSLIVSAGRGLKSDKEYINKDLLLDFLKEKMEETNTSSEDAVYWGMGAAFQQVYDKIKSL